MTDSLKNNSLIVFCAGAISGGIVYYYYNQYKKKKKYVKFNNNDTRINIPRQITKIEDTALELRKRFVSDGYVFVSKSLATANNELNELIALIKKMDLPIFNGCVNPSTCKCKFRYKNSRTFTVRRYSSSDSLTYYSPTCTGVKNIELTEKDITDNTQLYSFIKTFSESFSSTIFDLADYVRYITDPDMSKKYVIDIALTAEPSNTNISLNKDNHDIKWRHASFLDMVSNTITHYDIASQFVLSCNEITPHKIIIGRVNTETDMKSFNNNDIVNYVKDQWIENDAFDIGYIIDQRRGYIAQNPDYYYISKNGNRNVVSIKIKYFD